VTAAKQRTQPAVVAAISSGEGQLIAPELAPRSCGFQQGLMLLAAGIALGALTSLWVQRER
jgi:hypothetical protein